MKSNDRKTLLTAVAVSSLLAAGVGALVGKTMLSSPPKEALAVEAKEDHAGEKPHVGMSAERIAADGIQVLALAEGGSTPPFRPRRRWWPHPMARPPWPRGPTARSCGSTNA